MTIEEIKVWLKENRISRDIFGRNVGVSKSTVNSWLAGVCPIPVKRLAIIEQYIKDQNNAAISESVNADDFRTFPVLMTSEDYDLCLHAADARGLSVSDWAADVCTVAAADFAKSSSADCARER